MKTRKTPSYLASKLYNKTLKFDKKTDKLLSNPKPHLDKKDDLCNDNKCINPELKRHGFGQLPRAMMPQFPNLGSIKSLVSKISKKIGPVKHGYKLIPISELHPTQSEISKSKVEHILDKTPKHAIISHICKRPILTSYTGSVIDGHHRSEALKLAVKKGYIKNSKVRVYAIDLPAWVILSMANTFGFNKDSHAFS